MEYRFIKYNLADAKDAFVFRGQNHLIMADSLIVLDHYFYEMGLLADGCNLEDIYTICNSPDGSTKYDFLITTTTDLDMKMFNSVVRPNIDSIQEYLKRFDYLNM